MKRISLSAALLGAIVLAFAGVAMAGGNGTTVTQYDVTYADGFGAQEHCIGVHQVKNNGSVKGTVQDSFTCSTLDGSLLNGVTPGQTLNSPADVPGGTWISDYSYYVDGGKWIAAKTLTGQVSADGTSFTAVATY
jgi:hypothetical protein